MSHFITVPINENGIVYDTGMNQVVQEAMSVDPFGFNDVFLYSHGWGTDADAALDEYTSSPSIWPRKSCSSRRPSLARFPDCRAKRSGSVSTGRRRSPKIPIVR